LGGTIRLLLLLLHLLPSRRNRTGLWLCARCLLLWLRAWLRLRPHWSRFTTHLWLWLLLRRNYASLLLFLSPSRWCCDAFALRLLLSYGSRRTFSLRCAGCSLYSSLFVLLATLLLLNASLFALGVRCVTLRLSLLSGLGRLSLRSNGLCRLR
jgi:hypothetical protein